MSLLNQLFFVGLWQENILSRSVVCAPEHRLAATKCNQICPHKQPVILELFIFLTLRRKLHHLNYNKK